MSNRFVLDYSVVCAGCKLNYHDRETVLYGIHFKQFTIESKCPKCGHKTKFLLENPRYIEAEINKGVVIDFLKKVG
jgi:rRNA maturation endonuclease Nob1